MNCTICNKPIVLIPSASERAAKDVTGKSTQYYTSLFTTHVDCTLTKRTADLSKLLEKYNGPKEQANRNGRVVCQEPTNQKNQKGIRVNR